MGEGGKRWDREDLLGGRKPGKRCCPWGKPRTWGGKHYLRYRKWSDKEAAEVGEASDGSLE